MHPLKIARKSLDLSLCQVAIKVGIQGSAKAQSSQVSSWENGTNIPRIDRAEKLAALFGFQSGKEVQNVCHAWREEHVPKEEKPRQTVRKERNRKRKIDPYDRKEKLHPLREYREICSFTQEGLAIKLGFQDSKHGRARIAHWENGENIPSYDRAKKLAHILGFESAEEVQQRCQEWHKHQRKEGI